MSQSKGKFIFGRLTKKPLTLSQDYFNLVSIVCIEKKIPVQSAIEYAFVMHESAIRRWFDLRAQIPKFDPQMDEIVTEYVKGQEYLIR